MIMKRFCFVITIVFICFTFVACGKKRQQDSDVPSVPVTATPTGMDAHVPGFVDDYEPSGEIYMIPAPYETSQSVTMVIPRLFWSAISEESMNEINRILYEKGLDCQIIFVRADNVNTGAQYIRWLDYCEQTVPIDVLYSGNWNPEIDSEMIPFVEERFLPLNDYLKTEEADTLWNTYTEDEWMSGTINGKTYLIPRAAIDYNGKTCLDIGTYISVNEKYEEYFTDFDGTYASLKAIYERIGDSELCILTDGLDYIPALLGYSFVFQDELPYQRDAKRVIDITQADEYAKLLKNLYSDMCSGVLVDYPRTGVVPEQILAVIHRCRGLFVDGYKEYLISPDYHEFNWNGKYGVSVRSEKRELALKILSACFSDPDILCLLNPGSDREVLAHRMELLSDAPKSELAGIFFEETFSAMRKVKKYPSDAPRGLFAGIYYKTNPDDQYYLVNPNWDFDEAWKKFLIEYSYYYEIYDAANRDIANYFAETGR